MQYHPTELKDESAAEFALAQHGFTPRSGFVQHANPVRVLRSPDSQQPSAFARGILAALRVGKQRSYMPTISMFYGILIRMFFYDTDKHHVPHIHAEYQGQVAVYSIHDGTVLAGELPPKKHKLVVA